MALQIAKHTMLLDVSSHDKIHRVIVYHNWGPSRMIRTAALIGTSIFHHFQDEEYQGRRGGKKWQRMGVGQYRETLFSGHDMASVLINSQ